MAIELPEAAVLARQMQQVLPGKTIQHAFLSPKTASLKRQGFINAGSDQLEGRRIESVESKGKWIFIYLDDGSVLLLALETGGKILYHERYATIPAAAHLQITFADQSMLTEEIIGWGWAKIHRRDEIEAQRYPGRLGPSPLDENAFSFAYFSALFEDYPKKTLKDLLTDQYSIAGIGVGYLQDILFLARLHPKRRAASLTERERETLYETIVSTLRKAFELGGSSLHFNLYGNPGRYHRVMNGHQVGLPCPECGTRIEKHAIQGANISLCPRCQRMD